MKTVSGGWRFASVAAVICMVVAAVAGSGCGDGGNPEDGASGSGGGIVGGGSWIPDGAENNGGGGGGGNNGGGDADAGDTPDVAPDTEEADTDPPEPEPRQIPPPTEVSSKGRVVAVGDVHGDLGSTRDALRLAGAIDGEDRWIGGELVVVQVGDQLDRGGDEKAIIDLFERLADEAHAAGGGFYALLGNHETMNVQQDWRYVFPEGWEDFAEFAEGADPSDPDLQDADPSEWGRIIAFRPGGPYARILAGHNVVMVVDDTLFVHGGVHPEHISYDLAQLNADTQAWMRGDGSEPDILHGDESPVWSRHYSKETDASDCALLADVLAAAGLQRMVVAHSVQDDGINSECDEKVWRVDVGLADYYGGPTQVLEIVGDSVEVVE